MLQSPGVPHPGLDHPPPLGALRPSQSRAASQERGRLAGAAGAGGQFGYLCARRARCGKNADCERERDGAGRGPCAQERG